MDEPGEKKRGMVLGQRLERRQVLRWLRERMMPSGFDQLASSQLKTRAETIKTIIDGLEDNDHWHDMKDEDVTPV